MSGDLISRSALWSDIMMLPHNGDMISSDEVEEVIMRAEAVEAETVIHCKDCQKYRGGWCTRWGHSLLVQRPDGFCDGGKRR